MPHTRLGKTIEGWSDSSKAELKADLNKITSVPQEILASIVEKIARTHPACNTIELAELEAEQQSLPDPQALRDTISVFSYIWENMDGEDAPAVVADLLELNLITPDVTPLLTGLLESAEPFRQEARVASRYLRIGSPLFVGIRGTVDLRMRFHRTEEGFTAGRLPAEVVGVQQVVLVNLTLNRPSEVESVVTFLMDESDLKYMSRFVRNMERELELTKGLLPDPPVNDGERQR